MKLKLPDSVASQQDVEALLIEIKNYSNWFLHEQIKIESNIKHVSKSPELSSGAKTLFQEIFSKKSIGKDSLDSLIDTLNKYCDDAPIMTITLAAPVTNSVKETLVAWCRNNLAKNTLINFQFNTNLLGGMVVRFGSHIFDWSFRRQILENKHSFTKVLRNV
jgi:F0F1-type ATP synthase delta subunit